MHKPLYPQIQPDLRRRRLVNVQMTRFNSRLLFLHDQIRYGVITVCAGKVAHPRLASHLLELMLA